MDHQSSVAALTVTLAGGSLQGKIEAVLNLPDAAKSATAALESALTGAEPLLEVALLDALYRLHRDLQVRKRLEAILDSPAAQGDEGEELYMMARIALNRVEGQPEDALQGEGAAIHVLGIKVGKEPDRLAVVVHGTWARGGTWWRPGGVFHEYLLTELGLDYLYHGDEPFVWSGRNRDQARHNASEAFGDWVNQHRPKTLEVYAHSHGANVAMLATQQGLEINKLVMMSPPVRRDYFANWQRVEKAFNIQASFDPVVGIARGGRWFELPGTVAERELDVDGHSASHDPEAWRRNGLAEFVDLR